MQSDLLHIKKQKTKNQTLSLVILSVHKEKLILKELEITQYFNRKT